MSRGVTKQKVFLNNVHILIIIAKMFLNIVYSEKYFCTNIMNFFYEYHYMTFTTT